MDDSYSRRRLLASASASLAGPAVLGIGSASTACSVTIATNAETEDGEPKLELPPTETRIGGTTTCAPGKTLRIRIESEDFSPPFVMNPEVDVAEDGRFRQRVDLSEFAGASISITVYALNPSDAVPIASLSAAEIRPTANPECTATLSTNAQTDAGDPKLELRSSAPTIEGTTTCTPGSELRVRIASGNSSAPFVRNPSVTVGEDGRFALPVDLSDELDLDAETPEDASLPIEISVHAADTDERLTPRYAAEVIPEHDPAFGATIETNATTESGEPKLVLPAGEATIEGDTTCDEGRQIEIDVDSDPGPESFSERKWVRVDEEGRYEATVDFSDAQKFELEVEVLAARSNERVASLSNVEVEPEYDASCSVTIATNDRTESGSPLLSVPRGETHVVGRTTCEPGTELPVVVHTDGGAEFSYPTVTEAGLFEATFLLGDLDTDSASVQVYQPPNEPIGSATPVRIEDDREATHTAMIAGNGETPSGDPKLTLPAAETTVRGVCSSPVGTEVAVELVAANDGETTLARSTTSVAREGRFEASFDLTDRTGGSVRVRVVHVASGEPIGHFDAADIVSLEPRGSDRDGDGLFEDVNDNGEADFGDVTALFEDLDADAVAENPGAYDFNDNGELDFGDVVALFETL